MSRQSRFNEARDTQPCDTVDVSYVMPRYIVVQSCDGDPGDVWSRIALDIIPFGIVTERATNSDGSKLKWLQRGWTVMEPINVLKNQGVIRMAIQFLQGRAWWLNNRCFDFRRTALPIKTQKLFDRPCRKSKEIIVLLRLQVQFYTYLWCASLASGIPSIQDISGTLNRHRKGHVQLFDTSWASRPGDVLVVCSRAIQYFIKSWRNVSYIKVVKNWVTGRDFNARRCMNGSILGGKQSNIRRDYQ